MSLSKHPFGKSTLRLAHPTLNQMPYIFRNLLSCRRMAYVCRSYLRYHRLLCRLPMKLRHNLPALTSPDCTVPAASRLLLCASDSVRNRFRKDFCERAAVGLPPLPVPLRFSVQRLLHHLHSHWLWLVSLLHQRGIPNSPLRLSSPCYMLSNSPLYSYRR